MYRLNEAAPRFWGMLFVMLAVVGCGARATHSPVEGVVTIDGKPVSQGVRVVFTPEAEEAEPCAGVTNDKGRYVMYFKPGMKGLPPGKYTVSIPSPADDTSGTLIMPPELAGVTIPERYRPGHSTLVCDVPRGGTVYDIDLQSR